MEVAFKPKPLQWIVKSDLCIFLSFLVGWVLTCIFVPLYLYAPSVGFFILAASAVATWITSTLMTHRTLRMLPRFSDASVVVLSSVLATIAVELGVRLCTESSIAPLSLHFQVSFVSGIFSFCIFRAVMHYALEHGVRRNIFLNVTAEELELVKETLRVQQLASQVSLGDLQTLKLCLIAENIKHIDAIITSRQVTHSFSSEGTLLRSFIGGVPTFELIEMLNSLEGKVRLKFLDPVTYLTRGVQQNIILRFFRAVKDIAEPLIAVVALILLAPLFAIIAILIKRDSQGPVFYVQQRVGHFGKPIWVIKFRSMYTDAEVNGPQWAANNDSRITKIGAFLRKTRIDEIPQLINVLRGDMGLVGPRPERPEFYDKVRNTIPHFHLRTLVKPGITGWAQINAGYAASVEESKTKLEYDLYYIKNMSPKLDIIIMLRTVYVSLTGSERKESLAKKTAQQDFEVLEPHAVAGKVRRFKISA